jgi:hypothetical protein
VISANRRGKYAAKIISRNVRMADSQTMDDLFPNVNDNIIGELAERVRPSMRS